MRTFVDTNVLVYLFDAAQPDKQERAREVVAERARAGALVLSSPVLSEFYVTVTCKLAQPLPVASAQRALADLAVYPYVTVDAALVQRSAACAAAELCSEDFQQGRSFRGVTVRDPFSTTAG